MSAPVVWQRGDRVRFTLPQCREAYGEVLDVLAKGATLAVFTDGQAGATPALWVEAARCERVERKD